MSPQKKCLPGISEWDLTRGKQQSWCGNVTFILLSPGCLSGLALVTGTGTLISEPLWPLIIVYRKWPRGPLIEVDSVTLNSFSARRFQQEGNGHWWGCALPGMFPGGLRICYFIGIFFFFNSWECARKPQKCRNLIYQPVNCGQWNVSQGWGHMNQTQRTMKKPKGLPTYITKRAKGGWVLAAFGQKQRQTMWEVKFYKRKLLSDHRHWDEGS